MLITIEHNEQPVSSFKSKPQLLFICQATGEMDAIPRMMHSHNDRLEIMFIYRGSGNYIIDGEFYGVKEGDLLIFNAGSIHDEQPLPSKELIIFSCGIANLTLGDLPTNHIIGKQHIPVINTGLFYEQFRYFFESFIDYTKQKSPLQQEILYHTTLTFLLLIHRIFTEREQQLSHKKVSLGQRIKEFLDHYYLEKIDIESVSEALNVNRYYLSHVFKDFSGYSPKQYIIRRRMGEAQSLLLNTDYSVAKIGTHVGYHNVNNFHNIFEKVVGMSPGKYKKLWLSRS